ncbi:MAG: DUF6516 family protein [Caldilineaceae bacterium]
MTARDYYRSLQQTISRAFYVLDSQISYSEIDVNECYISGRLILSNGYQLHIAEYVITGMSIVRTKYRFHLQTAEAELVARWDNSPHHKEIDTFPDHCHLRNGSIVSSPAMNIESVLAVTLAFLD